MNEPITTTQEQQVILEIRQATVALTQLDQPMATNGQESLLDVALVALRNIVKIKKGDEILLSFTGIGAEQVNELQTLETTVDKLRFICQYWEDVSFFIDKKNQRVLLVGPYGF
ncbi:MAG: hypothetical protein Q8Q23_00500 [bacterium]|nr:hypothetical protein [bacterium]